MRQWLKKGDTVVHNGTTLRESSSWSVVLADEEIAVLSCCMKGGGDLIVDRKDWCDDSYTQWEIKLDEADMDPTWLRPGDKLLDKLSDGRAIVTTVSAESARALTHRGNTVQILRKNWTGTESINWRREQAQQMKESETEHKEQAPVVGRTYKSKLSKNSSCRVISVDGQDVFFRELDGRAHVRSLSDWHSLYDAESFRLCVGDILVSESHTLDLEAEVLSVGETEVTVRYLTPSERTYKLDIKTIAEGRGAWRKKE